MIKSRLKYHMEEKGITYAALEKMTGLSSQTITRARGDTIRECRLSTLEIMAKALGVNIVDLFDEREDK